MTDLELKAREMSRDFLENEKQYRLGFVEAEQSNPLTKTLGETFVKNTRDGVKMLTSVDRTLIETIGDTLASKEFSAFLFDVTATLKRSGRIIISGCGSTGRLAMRIEASWRRAIAELIKTSPDLAKYEDKVIEVMTGGDFAVIRSVESFEDYAQLGAMQIRELSLTENDLLIGVTATGETTSILGSAKEALSLGASVWMIVCTNPASVRQRLVRAEEVFGHKNTKSIYIKCGPFSVSGSSRMQSSTSEQLIISFALELTLSELLGEEPCINKKKDSFIRGFCECIELLDSDENVAMMSDAVDRECELYSRGGHVTYFADEYLLDVLTDTTERSPTFTTPPFRPQHQKDQPLSWAFVKNPTLKTQKAWCACFERTPHCIDKTDKEYIAIGVKEDDVKRIPKISLDAILKYEIGCEPDPEREGEGSLATWIDFSKDIPSELDSALLRYEKSSSLVLGKNAEFCVSTRLKIFEHIAIKLMLNTVSTGTMAKMGRVQGNFMVYLNISNKKLIDRATRIISELTGVSYEEANYELFLSKLDLEERGIERSTTIETIERLKNRK